MNRKGAGEVGGRETPIRRGEREIEEERYRVKESDR